jgi:hypothetical protein
MKLSKIFIFFLSAVLCFHYALGGNVNHSDVVDTLLQNDNQSKDDIYYSPPKNLEKRTDPSSAYYTHDGFHFEFSFGPAFGKITERISGFSVSNKYELTGTGVGIDVKLGGALKQNLFLTVDLIDKTIFVPAFEVNGVSYPISSKSSVSEVLYGGGVTYFAMTNLFFSATAGIGGFIADNSVTSLKSDYGFGFQLKGGKHWWISPQWGISIAAAYGFTAVNNLGDKYAAYTDDVKSDRFTILAGIVFH